MLEPMKTLAEKVAELRQKKGWTQGELAAAVGVSQGSIGNIESGIRPNPRAATVLGIARALGVSAQWLQSGEGEMVPSDSMPPNSFPVNKTKIRDVFVVGRGSGGVMPERIWADCDYPVGATDECAEIATSDPHAFITQVMGTSMIPRYNPSEYALVEPGTDPELEDDVLVRLKSGQTMIKRLLSRRNGYRFGSYNDPEILHYSDADVTWVYYIAHPVPRRKIKTRC